MNLPSKQQALLDRCRQDGQITSQTAYEMLSAYYYHNHEKYIGEILSRMVKSGKFIRVKPRLFQLGIGKANTAITNQGALF